MDVKSSIKTSFFFLIPFFCVILFFTSPCYCDPDQLQDFCVADLNATTTFLNGFPCKPVSQVSSSDFFFVMFFHFRGLNTLGLSMNRVDLAPGGVNPLHTHPRATEAGIVVMGKVLVLDEGNMFVIPKGLVHFQKNAGPGKAILLTSFNSQLPGAAVLPTTLFASNPEIPNDILAKNFLVDETVITSIKSNMKTSIFLPILILCVILFFTSPCYSDPDQLQDFCVADLNATETFLNGFPCKPMSQVSSSDFFFSGFTKEGNTSNNFGLAVTPDNVLSFTGLNTLGLSMNRVDYAPGATEAGVILKGKVLVGFISTTNIFYSKVLKAGEMFVIPKGLVHFQKNVGRAKAVTITSFNSQLPGAAVLPATIFASNPAIPNDILAKNFQVDETVITSIKSKFGSYEYSLSITSLSLCALLQSFPKLKN
ncbi:hypothetical protein MKW92_003941 [Papaver armeniacum]|nr:hypothetical protein MKW92_003941 [Papaver armeniacum]